MIETIESPCIHAAISINFKTLELENSNHDPVRVNFWSKKTGPCLRQYPILDKLISENKTEHTHDLTANAIVEDPENPRLPLAMCKMLKHQGLYADAMKILKSFHWCLDIGQI